MRFKIGVFVKEETSSFFSLFSFFEEQRAPRERAPSSELRLEGKGVKRSRETVVPFCEVVENFRQGSEKNGM